MVNENNTEERRRIGERAYDEFLRLGIGFEAFSRKYGVDNRCIRRWRTNNCPSAFALRCLQMEGANIAYILGGADEG